MKTLGISPKAVLAAVIPTLGGVIAVAVQWLVTGELDRAELGTAVGTVAAALLAFLGAYAGDPGNIATHASQSGNTNPGGVLGQPQNLALEVPGGGVVPDGGRE